MTAMTSTSSFFFVQVSDLQFGMFEPGAGTYWETPLVERMVARINALAPAFVICNGDVIDIPVSDTQLDEAQRRLGGIDPGIPVHMVPGNHDIGDAPNTAGLDWYRRRVGPDWYSFDHGGWHFVGINSCLVADSRHVRGQEEQQWSWLVDDLAAAGATPILVFMHHPLFLETATEPDHYFNLGSGARARYVELFRGHGIGIILAGHLHRNNVASDAGMEVVTTGPVGMPLGDGVSGLRIVKVGPGTLEHRYFDLEDAAGQEAYLETT